MNTDLNLQSDTNFTVYSILFQPRESISDCSLKIRTNYIEYRTQYESCITPPVRVRANRAFLVRESRATRTTPARFGNASTARNPTHRAMTNATFTSGCVHGHRAWFRRLCSPPVSTRRLSAVLAAISTFIVLPHDCHLRSAVLYHPRDLFCLSYVHPESQHIRWVAKRVSSHPSYLVPPRSLPRAFSSLSSFVSPVVVLPPLRVTSLRERGR